MILFLCSVLQPSVQTFASNAGAKLIIHYQEAPGNTKDWNIWVWPEGGEGRAYPFTGEDEFGKVAEIELEGDMKRAGFIIRTDTWEKDGEQDRWIDISGGEGEVWVKSGDSQTYTEPPDGEYRDLPKYEKVKVKIHYYRHDSNYEGWNLWMWPEGKDGKTVYFTDEDSFGMVAETELSSDEAFSKAGFIVKQTKDGDEWANKEFEDRFITKFKPDGSAEIWIIQGTERVYHEEPLVDLTPKILKAEMDKLNEITLETNYPFPLQNRNAGISIEGLEIKEVLPFEPSHTGETSKVRIITKKNMDPAKVYRLTMEGFGAAQVNMGAAVRTDEFDRYYSYSGTDLGNIYKKNKTSFKLWAPTAAEAKLVVYKTWNSKDGREYPMKKGPKGTWEYALKGNQDGLIYTYKVKIGSEWNEAADPYAKAVTVNGDRGAVADLSTTDPRKWTKKKPKLNKPEDAVFYELHIRDLSIQKNSGIKNKGKYLGVAEKGTKGPGGYKTGLSHIKELGVTHVQLLPMYDYRTVDETKLDVPQYNWGYDPKNYNAPEGSYASDPYKPKVRIKEMKQMIQALHDENLRVVMDVVYNHMFSVNESHFNQLVPGYYFRYNADGTLANGSGVGNDTASERKMMRKFIVDSVSYWAEEYHLDGFRFDLMGIHDTQTMNEVKKALKKVDKSIMVIGEGWDLNTPLPADRKANQKNADKMPGIAHFNDQIRDSLKGSVFQDLDPGFVNGRPELAAEIKKGLAAGFAKGFLYDEKTAAYKDPEQVVTYVEAHDNHTLWDKLLLTNAAAPESERKQMHRLASSVVLTSQGISFLHAGQEFMRTKYGDHNSYKSPDSVNQLDWTRRAQFAEDVTYMQGLIKLRKNYPAFRLGEAKEINKYLHFIESPNGTAAFVLDNPESKKPSGAGQLAVIHNAGKKAVTVTLPSRGKWSILVNGKKAGIKELGRVNGDKVSVSALSTFVLIKK